MSIPIILHENGADRDYSFDFKDFEEIEVNGLTISSATATTPDGAGSLTVATPTVSGSIVTVRILGSVGDDPVCVVITALLSNSRDLPKTYRFKNPAAGCG